MFCRNHTASSSKGKCPGFWLCFGGPELILFAILIIVLVFSGCGKTQDPVAGLWQAAIHSEGQPDIGFQIDVARDGGKVTGALVNGPDREEATSGSFDGNTLILRFDHYDAELRASMKGRDLEGEFVRQRGKTKRIYSFSATRTPQEYAANVDGLPLSGDWILTVGEGEQRKVWSATLQQNGGKLSGTVIPISGDWGTLTGYVRDGEIYLSRFDGIRALLWTGQITADGRIEGSFEDGRKVVAERADQAIAQGTKPLDPETYTKVKDPNEPFHFEGLDINGQKVSSTDPRFAGKVVLVTITGTWCPNCHDEAPVLVEFYRKYKDQGLEVVALAYEYTGDVARDLEQLKIYAKRHAIEFPLLLAGTTEAGEIARTLPQLENFGAYPTTIYLNREGKVTHIHAGFESKITGERHQKLVASMEERVQEMLKEGKAH